MPRLVSCQLSVDLFSTLFVLVFGQIVSLTISNRPNSENVIFGDNVIIGDNVIFGPNIYIYIIYTDHVTSLRLLGTAAA